MNLDGYKKAHFKRKYQFIVWFPLWRGIGFRKLTSREYELSRYYRWFLCLGYWEIRKWA